MKNSATFYKKILEEKFWKSGQWEAIYIYWNITWSSVIYISPIAVRAIPWETGAASSKLVTQVTYVKYLNSDAIINIWKKIRKGERKRRIRLNERFQSRK